MKNEINKIITKHIPNLDINQILDVNNNLSEESKKKIIVAYEYAKDKHKLQKRSSGEEYIIHPMNVAYILSSMSLDSDTIIAALLHDVIEDTDTTKEEIANLFGDIVANMVDGVTKLKRMKYTAKEEIQVETYRRMFLAMGKDFRTILIKLADRLHNMRTLEYMTRAKQIEKAKETLDIYAPLANRLGIYFIKGELEDLSFKYLMPHEYRNVLTALTNSEKNREEFLEKIRKNLIEKLNEMEIEFEIDGRVKHIYSLYKKIKRDHKTIDQIYDIFAFRIITDTKQNCYKILGMLHDKYLPLMGRFKDYIAVPKRNLYQSIHTTVMEKGNKYDTPFEIQVRTKEMHNVAEYGIAAHWAYKEENYKGKKATVTVQEDKLSWLRQTIEWQEQTKDPKQFLDALKTELFDDEVYIYTPKGEIKMLPKGANGIDLAYLIHEGIGNKMTGVKINSKVMPILTKLNNGDIVQIITSDNAKGPSMDWIKFVKTQSAKSKILKWFKKEKREEHVDKGKELIEKEVKKMGIKPQEILKEEWLKDIAEKSSFLSADDIYAAIGFGNISARKLISKLLVFYKEKNKEKILEEKLKLIKEKEEIKKQKNVNKEISSQGVIVKGIDNCLVKIAKCCNPVPGDEIIGYITKGRGISIHRAECNNIDCMHDKDIRTIEVYWDENVKKNYEVELIIYSVANPDLLRNIIKIIERENININGIDTKNKVKEMKTEINLRIIVKNHQELKKIIHEMQNIDSVYDIVRKRS